MSTNDGGSTFPQSMRQRRILDVAREHPTASVAELASMVSSATPELVERVLDRHGDPCADGGSSTDTAEATDGSSMAETTAEPTDEDGSPSTDGNAESESGEAEPDTDSTADTSPDIEQLSERQREILAVVAARPEATQRELADRFDV
ncbi:MAG: hypothetical protein ACOC0Z_06730, partial [Halohasta sp.]